MALALKLASSCEHPEARWLTSVCAGKGLSSWEEARQIFLALGENDARGLCFAWRLEDKAVCGNRDSDDEREVDLTLLRRSAGLGCALAQSELAQETHGEESFQAAQMAAAQGERDGFYALGVCYHNCEGCDEDLEKSNENMMLAAELGHVYAMAPAGSCFEESDPRRWDYWAVAAAHQAGWNFLSSFSKQVEKFHSGSGGSAAAVFAIGHALKGHVNEKERKIFNVDFEFDSWIDPAKQAVEFFDAQTKACLESIHAWTQVGIRLKIVKDIRILIGKLVWEARGEAKYEIRKKEVRSARTSKRTRK